MLSKAKSQAFLLRHEKNRVSAQASSPLKLQARKVKRKKNLWPKYLPRSKQLCWKLMALPTPGGSLDKKPASSIHRTEHLYHTRASLEAAWAQRSLQQVSNGCLLTHDART